MMKDRISKGVVAYSLMAAAAGAALWVRTRPEAPAVPQQAAPPDEAPDAPLDAAEVQVILLEAARKRFKVARPTGALGEAMPKDEREVQEILDSVAVEMLKERLVLEKMERDPSFRDDLEDAMLERQPKLLRLTQASEDGFVAEQWVVVFDTTACSLEDESTDEALASELEDLFCMDPVLEYPGGFDSSRPISLSVHPLHDLGAQPEAQGQWAARLLLEAKGAVASEFAQGYKRDGRLTL